MELRIRKVPADALLQVYAQMVPGMEHKAVETTLAFVRTASEFYAGFEARIATYGLSQGKFGVLIMLHGERDQGMSPSDLAEMGGVTRGTITGLLDGLERQGLIERVRNPHDRRMQNVRLSQKGHALLQEVVPEHYQFAASLAASLTEEEKAQLRHLLSKIQIARP